MTDELICNICIALVSRVEHCLAAFEVISRPLGSLRSRKGGYSIILGVKFPPIPLIRKLETRKNYDNAIKVKFFFN